MESKYKDAILERVKEYVDPDYFDQDVVIDYLLSHNIIESEIFKLSFKNGNPAQSRETRVRIAESVIYGGRPVQTGRGRPRLPEQAYGFYPTDIAAFLDRMPFYFYINKTKNRYGGFWELAFAYKQYKHAFDFFEETEAHAKFLIDCVKVK